MQLSRPNKALQPTSGIGSRPIERLWWARLSLALAARKCVNLDPTIGQEIKKTRPAVVVSSNSIGKLPLKIIVPIMDWKPP